MREVIKRIEQIVHLECLISNTSRSFTATEVFLLIISSYAHDLGMAVFPGEEIRL
ncbi:HD domain-containing protein [Geosporobacter ferrireducens]